MKTFETEKHNIPEGATHYQDQDEDHLFAWFKLDGEDLSINVPDQGIPDAWFDCSISYFRGKIKPIPQTKEVEWVNGLPPVGVECEWIGGGLNHGDWGLVIVHAYHDDSAWIEKLHNKSMHTVVNPAHFRRPETEAERIEREELEAAYDLYCEWVNIAGIAFEDWKLEPDYYGKWLRVVRKTGYRKESE